MNVFKKAWNDSDNNLDVAKDRRRAAKVICITKDCGSEVKRHKGRRLCEACYMAAFRLIKAKQTTWEELETGGLALPRLHPERNCFKKAFQQLKGGNRGNRQD